MDKILIVNGPNLNLLGKRETNIYGRESIDKLEALCIEKAAAFDYEVIFIQKNSEGEIINIIQNYYQQGINKLIINAAGFSHTSIAIMDCILATNMITIEIHLSNINNRDDFRENSYIAKASRGTISGLGFQGYLFAIEYLCKL